MIHDQHCRCRSCKPGLPPGLVSVIEPYSPGRSHVSPHIRRNMDRIVWAVLLLASVCLLILVLAGGR